MEISVPEAVGQTFPPAPWALRGTMRGAVLRLPADALPPGFLPLSHKAFRRDGSLLAVAAWVDYGPGSVLTYREFMVAAISRIAFPLTVTVPRIWVDDPRSLAGGRQLWWIPKERAEFAFDAVDSRFQGTMTVAGRDVVSYRYAERRKVPARWPCRAAIVQELDGATRRTAASWFGAISFGDGTLTVPDDSELAFLRAGRPVTHLAIDFRARFGLRSTVVSAGR